MSVLNYERLMSEKFLILGKAEWDIILNAINYTQYIKYSVEFAHLFSFCNSICGWAENMVMMMMMLNMTMISRRRTGYPRTVTFGSVYKTPVLQYFCTPSHSQQSVQAAIQHVNNTVPKSPCMSFHWPGATVTAVKHKICHSVHECQHVSAICLIYRWHKTTNLYVSFKQHHILISAACCLSVLLPHNGCLAEFCIYQAIKFTTYISYIADWYICMLC